MGSIDDGRKRFAVRRLRAVERPISAEALAPDAPASVARGRAMYLEQHGLPIPTDEPTPPAAA
ncbi:hypothetical protein BH10ACT1_BH10ACT1_33350 [soil metagenome]